METNPDFRWYPKRGSVVGYVDGAAVPLASVDTDGRAATFAAPPAPGATVKATYQGLRLVRFVGPAAYQGVTKQFGRYQLGLEEVLRD